MLAKPVAGTSRNLGWPVDAARRTGPSLKASRRNPLETNPGATSPAALSLDVGGQLVGLAEETAASTVLGSFALVVRHGSRLA